MDGNANIADMESVITILTNLKTRVQNEELEDPSVMAINQYVHTIQ